MTGRPPASRSEAIWRAVEANRATYVSGARIQELEEALVKAGTEAERLTNRLIAFETSTIWALTKPIRSVLQLVKGLRGTANVAVAPPPAPPVPFPMDRDGYLEWIANEEPDAFARLLRSGPGHQPVTLPKLGLLLWTEETQGPVVAQQIASALLQIPTSCGVFVVCPPETLEFGRQATMASGRLDARFAEGASRCIDLPGTLACLAADYICFHHLGDTIADQALQTVAVALAEQPQTTILFGDEDWVGPDGNRTRPFFKPGWDAELQRGQDLIGPFAFYAASSLEGATTMDLSDPAWRYGLASRLAAASLPERLRHVPVVLCHRVAPLAAGYAAATRRHTERQLQTQGITAQVLPLAGNEGWQRIVYAAPIDEPLVSIIVPTRDRPELLRTCADGILNQTDYRRLELIIVDNGTVDPEALTLMDALAADDRVRVLRHPGVFNWSSLNNAGIGQAEGEVLVLLNNDIAVLQPDWLRAMVAQVMQPGIGAVGAKLLYQDGRVQHAGITTDKGGVPRHIYRFAGADESGSCGALALARSVWAVTGACLAVRRAAFFEVGGLNEGLPVAYNDVEFCLRLTAQGYRNVWTPLAILEHRELASRAPDHVGARREQSREELNRLHRDWGDMVLHDPYLSPNFDLISENLHFRHSQKNPGRTRFVQF